MNPKQMQKMMAQLGIKNVDIPATRVVIEKPDGQIIINKPSVTLIEMQGQKSFQIAGTVTEEAAAAFSEEDVRMVQAQTGATKEAAEAALKETQGDIAQAILKLGKK